jgi:hypothetical protein
MFSCFGKSMYRNGYIVHILTKIKYAYNPSIVKFN